MKDDFNTFESGNYSKKDIYQLLNTFRDAFDESIICSITDSSGKITYANKKFNEISQYSDYELIGHSYEKLNSGHHSDMFFKKMRETLGNGNIWHHEVKNQAKDRSYYWVDTVMIPLKNKEGDPIKNLTIQMLITEARSKQEMELKKVEEKRIKYLHCLEQILFMTSHRVRKPIATFMGLMQIIDQDDQLSDKEQKKILEYAKSTAQELNTFTEELTCFVCKVIDMYEDTAGYD